MIPVQYQRPSAFLAIAGALLAIGVPGSAIVESREPPGVVVVQKKGGRASAAVRPTAPKPGPPAPRNLEPLPSGQYLGILGKKVTGPDGKDMGLLVDVIVDADRTPRAAVIDFGGFLGVGSRKIAVDWRLLNFAPDREDGKIWLGLDWAEIRAAPEYRPGSASAEMVGRPWTAPLSPPP